MKNITILIEISVLCFLVGGLIAYAVLVSIKRNQLKSRVDKLEANNELLKSKKSKLDEIAAYLNNHYSDSVECVKYNRNTPDEYFEIALKLLILNRDTDFHIEVGGSEIVNKSGIIDYNDGLYLSIAVRSNTLTLGVEDAREESKSDYNEIGVFLLC